MDNTYTQKIIDFNFCGQLRYKTGATRKTAYFVMPVEEHGELYGLLEKSQGFRESTVRILYRDLIEGKQGDNSSCGVLTQEKHSSQRHQA